MAPLHCTSVFIQLVGLLMAAAAFHLPVDLPTHGASEVVSNEQQQLDKMKKLSEGRKSGAADAASSSQARANAAHPKTQLLEEIPASTKSHPEQPKNDIQTLGLHKWQQQLSDLQRLRKNAIVNGTSKVLPLNSIDDGVGEGDVMELPNSEIPFHNHQQFTWTWLQYLTYGVVVKGSCVIGNILSQLSPYPTVKKLRTKGDTGDFDALPFVTIAANSVQWCFYGVFAWWITGHHGFLILLYANVLGAIAGSFYTATFDRLCHSAIGRKSLRRYYYVSVLILLVQVLAAVALPPQHAMFFEGFMASACSIFVAVSPIACIPTVLQTQSTESMPVELALVSFVSAFLWLTCGIMLMDWWIIIPNIVGIGAGIIAIVLLFTYPRQSHVSTLSETTPLCTMSVHDDGCTGGTPSTLAPSLSPAQALWGNQPWEEQDSQDPPGTRLESPFTASSPGIY